MFIRRLIGKNFKKTDYDLNLHERKAKFKYFQIVCGVCERTFDIHCFYCKYCYNMETNEEKRNHMLYGKCKWCLQICTGTNWCSSCGFRSYDDIIYCILTHQIMI